MYCRVLCLSAFALCAPRPSFFSASRGLRQLARRGGGQMEGSTEKGRAALLLIDFQKAFTVGEWAQHFGGAKEVGDIERACEATAVLLNSGRVPEDTPIICTKCYMGGRFDEPYVDALEPLLRDKYCIQKSTMDVTLNRAFFPWLRQQVQLGVKVLVVGGCTTTSCVRVSSQQIVRQLGEQGLPDVKVVVDLNLCGARAGNYAATADQDPVLIKAYGRELCVGKSAVDLAVLQMQRSGVEVLDAGSGGWHW